MSDIRLRYGRRIANPNANPSAVKISPCPVEYACQDSGSKSSVADTVTATGVIIVDGTNDPVPVSFPAAISVTDTDAIEAAIAQILEDGVPEKEYDNWVRLSYDADAEVLKASHIGVLSLTTLVLSAGGNMTLTRACDVYTQSQFVFEVEDGTSGTINGVAIAGGPFDVSSDSAALQAGVEAALTTAGVDYQEVVVSADSEKFTVTVFARSGETFTANGATVVESNAKQQFE